MKHAHNVLPILCLLLITAGCNMKRVPLFNEDAPLINRIYSAREFRMELATQVSEIRDRGWLTQEQVNTGVGKSIIEAGKVIDEAESLYMLGQNTESDSKLASARVMLESLKVTLSNIRKEHQ